MAAPSIYFSQATWDDTTARLVTLIDSNGVFYTAGGGAGITSVDVASYGGTAVGIGQTAMASSMPVAIASDQTWVGATNLGKHEDAVHASSDVGIMALAVRTDDPSPIGAQGDYTPLLTSEVGGLWTEHVPNEVEAGNSTTSTLTASAVFTGTGIDILHHDIVTITIDASHNSAVDGMQFQFSTDNSNWDDVYTFTYTASDGARRFQFPVTSQFFRVVFTNGGTNQTHFRLQTIMHHANTLTTIHRVGDSLTLDRSAQLVKAVISGETTAGGGGMVNVKVNPSGTLEVNASQDTASDLQAQVESFPRSLSGRPVPYEDTNFTVGESPVTLDVNTDLGRNAVEGYIACDGPGDIIVTISDDGASFSSNITLKAHEVFDLQFLDVDQIKITHSGTDSAYRVVVV
ncbi:hypothetical protein LCGC14_1925940 [marine sediment metagenome]|uniref:Uncharacterized protein n=1 Tax=marine sediment metagenome TaxID=412755 RepID=A0A0F9FQ16_9ZZZZ